MELTNDSFDLLQKRVMDLVEYEKYISKNFPQIHDEAWSNIINEEENDG